LTIISNGALGQSLVHSQVVILYDSDFCWVRTIPPVVWIEIGFQAEFSQFFLIEVLSSFSITLIGFPLIIVDFI